MAISSGIPTYQLKRTFYVVVALLGASAVGVASAIDFRLAVAACLALIALPVALVRPKLIPPVLIVSVFGAALELGSVTVGRLIAPLGILAAIAHILQTPIELRGSRGLFAVGGGYVVLAFASILWSVDSGATLDSLLTLAVSVSYAATIAFLVRDEKDLRRLLWAIALSSLALAVLWITSYATGVDRRLNEAGDPNFFAALQVVSLPLVMVLASTTRHALHRLLLGVATVLIAASIISTLSLGGLIAMGTAALMIAVLPASTLFRSRPQKGAFLVAALIGLGGLFLIAQEDINRRLEIKVSHEDVSGGRGDLWDAAMNGYRHHPWGGLGYGAFYGTSFELLRTTPGVDLGRHLRFIGVGEYVHNAYLGSLAELGPGGLLFFLGILGAGFRTLWRTAKRAAAANDVFKRSVSNALMVALLSFAVSSFTLSTETSRTLWTIVGVTMALASMTPVAATPRRKPRVAASFLLENSNQAVVRSQRVSQLHNF